LALGAPKRLQDVFVIGKPTPFAGTASEAFHELLGAPAPRGYDAVLAHFGVDASFCDRLHVMTPEQCRTSKESKESAARRAGLPGYYDAQLWKNFGEYFTADDATKLVSIASSIDAEDIVLMPELDELFYVPNPRWFGRIEVAGADVEAALDHFRRRKDVEIPFLLCREGRHTSRHEVGDARDWTEVLFKTTPAELVDERAWNYFYPAARAMVSLVEGSEIVIHCGADADACDAFVTRTMELFSTPPRGARPHG
jgi:hypothetical protein